MITRLASFPAALLAASLLASPLFADPVPIESAPLQIAPLQIAPLQIAQGDSELDTWNAIKDSKNADDYQRYLDKYPNGNFADLAKLRVKKYAPATPAPAAEPAAAAVDPQQADIAYWNGIKSSKNVADYKTYLEKYPNGEFVDLAKLRIDQLSAPAATEQPAEPAPAAPAAAEPASVEAPATAAPAPALTFDAKDATVYAKNGGQLRAEPDAKATLVTKLKTNTEVHATGLSSDGNWWKVEVAGQSGYMHRTVVSEKPVTVAAPSSKKKVEPAPAAASGPDEDLCKLGSQANANQRVSACERLVAKAGDDKAKLAGLSALAAALNKAGRRDEAIRKYEQAAVLDPRNPTIYYDIGLVRLDQLRFPEARAAFEKAATIDNQDSDIVFQRGVATIGFGDFEKAKLEVERALLTPNDPALYYEKLGEINVARGDLAAAKMALERGAKADSGRKSLILAAVNYLVGDQNAASANVAAVADAPTAALWNAVIKQAKGDTAGATAALEAGKGASGDDWPGTAFDVLAGTQSLAKARTTLRSKQAQLCALNFFAGEWAYLSGDKEAARAALQAALDTRAYWTLEYAAAKGRLANM